VLAAGATCSFGNAYESVDVFYTQDAGQGSLAFSYNGAAAYKTVACAGANELDKWSGSTVTGPSATGQAAWGTYTLTAVGGPVEITGIMRLGLKVANTPPRLVTFRAARDGLQFPDYTAARVASVIKQAAFAGGTKPPFVLIALGTNDMGSVAPATVKSRALALIASLRTAGVTRLAAIMPTRPAPVAAFTYPAGSSYDAAIGALTDAYAAQAVPVIASNSVDWTAEGLTNDGVHPNDAGYDRLAQVVIEALAG
jgi:hypothetical protein